MLTSVGDGGLQRGEDGADSDGAGGLGELAAGGGGARGNDVLNLDLRVQRVGESPIFFLFIIFIFLSSARGKFTMVF